MKVRAQEAEEREREARADSSTEADPVGAIWIRRSEFVGSMGETVGYKSGLALSREQLAESGPADTREVWFGDDDSLFRIRANVFEETVAAILYRIGNIPSPSTAPPGIALHHRYKNDPVMYEVFMDVYGLFVEFLPGGIAAAEAEGRKSVDPRPFFEEVVRRHGERGARIALECCEEVNLMVHRYPFGPFRRVEWSDVQQLNDLFESESLETYYGAFLDQRFIDYLAANFGDIDRINWRKFEGLACEFFERSGCYVEIGQGRNDGGIDGRVWPRREDRSSPPAILIQAKRQQDKVEKLVVKALYTDVVEEQAGSGLIVTTSALSRGARQVCTARAYPIREANRETIRAWVQAMRTPLSGAFGAE